MLNPKITIHQTECNAMRAEKKKKSNELLLFGLASSFWPLSPSTKLLFPNHFVTELFCKTRRSIVTLQTQHFCLLLVVQQCILLSIQKKIIFPCKKTLSYWGGGGGGKGRGVFFKISFGGKGAFLVFCPFKIQTKGGQGM